MPMTSSPHPNSLVLRFSVPFGAVVFSALAYPALSQPVQAPSTTEQTSYSSDSSSYTLGMRVGNHGEYRNTTLFLQSPVWWTKAFNNGGHVDLVGEVAATYWRSKHHSPKNLWQVGVAPIFRWWPSSERPFFLEAGAGVTYVSRTDFASYHLSTAMQFGTHVGMGYVFNDRHQLAFRLSHYSNARIKRPNNGLNIAQLEYAVRF